MSSDTAEFFHPALLYRDDAEYLAGTVPFVRAGLAAGEAVAVSVPEPNLRLLQGALGADAPRVVFHDMTTVGRNPGRIIPGVLLAFADRHPGRRVRIIGEPIWAGRSPSEYPACAQHEALINAAFASRAVTILCPYDTAKLHPVWIQDAYKTHPVMMTSDATWPSPQYHDPLAVAAEFNLPLAPPPAGAVTVSVSLESLTAVRQLVTQHAIQAGLTPERSHDVELTASELATNSIEHGGGSGQLVVWTDDQHLVCQFNDAGRLHNPLAGRIPAAPDAEGKGRGLLIVNLLCDLVRVHTGVTGTTTRVCFSLMGHAPVRATRRH